MSVYQADWFVDEDGQFDRDAALGADPSGDGGEGGDMVDEEGSILAMDGTCYASLPPDT
jgi:hypothetical protein